MKKLVAVIGSNNEMSLTGHVVQNTVHRLYERGVINEYDLIYLKDYRIEYCMGCSSCFKTGSCGMDIVDDMKLIREKLLDSDVIIMAAPVYFLNVPGKFKNLLDRLSRDIHLMKYAGRYGFTVTVTNSSGADTVSEYLKIVQLSLGITNLNNYRYINMNESSEDFTNTIIEDIIQKLNGQCTFSKYYLEKLFIMCRKLYTQSLLATAETNYWKQKWVANAHNFKEFALQNRLNEHRTPYIDNGVLPEDIFSFTDKSNVCNYENKIQIEKYLEKIFFRFLTGKVDPYMHSHFLILICECFDVLKNPEYWKAVGYTLCKDIKDEIEINGIKGKLGIWSGVGIKAFAINEYCNRFGALERPNHSVLNLLMSELESLCKSYLFNQDSITIRQYDVCFGVCGLFYFLLDNINVDDLQMMPHTISYLIRLTEINEKNGTPNFLINSFGQLNEEDKEKYKKGAINLGMAHGVIGILVVLTKAKYKGIKCEKLDYAINNLFSFYDEQCASIDGGLYWKPQISYDEWEQNVKVTKENIERASWCYGSLGILRGLQKASTYICDIERENKYKSAIKHLLEMPIDKLGLDSPILCHGYSGILMLITSEYKQYKDKEYLKNMNIIISKILNESFENDGNIDLHVFEEDESILQGMFGVAMALVGVLTMNSSYEKLFLMD